MLYDKNSTSDARLILLVCFFTTLSFFSVDLVTPALPSIMRSLATNAGHIKFIVLTYLVGIGIAQFFYGPLSDRFGRRCVVLIGASICLIGNLLAAHAHSLWQLGLARFISAFGSGASMIIARVVFRDVFTESRLLRANSFFSMSVNISPAIAPFIGGLMQQYLGWRYTFLFLSAWAVLVLITLSRYLPETLPKAKRIKINIPIMLVRYRHILRNRQFLYSALLSGTCLAASLVYFLMSPFLYQLIMGLSPAQNGLVYLANAAGFILGVLPVNRLSYKYTPQQFMMVGLGVCLTASILMLTIGLLGIIQPWGLLLPAGLNSIGFGLTMPASSTLSIGSVKSGTGLAAALLGGIRLLTVAICSTFAVLLHEHNQIPLGFLMMGLICISLFWYRKLLNIPKVF